MAYTRYFAIRSGAAPYSLRSLGPANNGAASLSCVLLGREAGGLCDSAEAEIPAAFPEDWGIRACDWLIAGYNSSNLWWSGIIDKVDLTGPGGGTVRVSAKGIEHELKSIYPVVDFGKDYDETTAEGDPYATYQNPTLKAIARTTSTPSIIKTLWTDYIVGKVRGVAVGSSCDIDSADTGTDAAYLVYDGSVSLYEILNSLAERTGMSWGFYPSSVMNVHTFFFKRPSGVFDPNLHKFYYGVNCVELAAETNQNQVVNSLTLTGGAVPEIGQTFSRLMVDPQSQEQYGARHVTKRIPGVRRTIDAQVHAAAVFDRRRDPYPALRCKCLAVGTTATDGKRSVQILDDYSLIYPGQTPIRIADEYGAGYNLDASQRLTNQISVFFGETAIEMEFTLGEAKPRTLDLWKDALLRNVGTRPRQGWEYTAPAAKTWDPGVRTPNCRMDICSHIGVVEADNGDGTGTVRIAQDAEGGSDADPYRELYTNIPLPSGIEVGDSVGINKYYEDGELKDVGTEALSATATGAVPVSEDDVIKIVNYHMNATGRIALSNLTKIRDLGDAVLSGLDDALLEHAEGDGIPQGRLGQIVRLPAENLPALCSSIRAIRSETFDAALSEIRAAFPTGAPDEAKLFDRVLKLSNDGKVGLAAVVKVVIAEIVRNLYLQNASDYERGEVVAAPNAVTKANPS
ncbi:MAG: hypothetical protein AB1656_05140 [Candidatus Omnitrophota bacterium]